VTNPAANEEKILRESKTIAVVGLSGNPLRPSHGVAEYLQQHGYRIIPVNPAESEILGEKSYPDLDSIPEPVDCVDVFRKSEAVPGIAAAAIRIGAKALWLQEGVVHDESAAEAAAAGLLVVQDRCLLKEHRRLRLGESSRPGS
jgi:predicted CoA-binding protein